MRIVTKLLTGCRTIPAEAFSIFWRQRSWLGMGIGRELVEREAEQPAVQRAFFVVSFGTAGVTAERKEFVGKNPKTRLDTLMPHTTRTTRTTSQVSLCSPRNVFSSVFKCELRPFSRGLGRIYPTGVVPLWFPAFTLPCEFTAGTRAPLSGP